jgi:hypothetical protein
VALAALVYLTGAPAWLIALAAALTTQSTYCLDVQTAQAARSAMRC